MNVYGYATSACSSYERVRSPPETLMAGAQQDLKKIIQNCYIYTGLGKSFKGAVGDEQKEYRRRVYDGIETPLSGVCLNEEER